MIEHNIYDDELDNCAYACYKKYYKKRNHDSTSIIDKDFFIRHRKILSEYYKQAEKILRKKKLEKIINHVQ